MKLPPVLGGCPWKHPVLAPEPLLLFPQPACLGQATEGEMCPLGALWVGDRTQGAGRVASPRAWPFLPPLPGTASDHCLSLLTACDTSEGKQLLFLSCPQPATTASMATGSEWSCPICREASGDIAYVGSCLHQFCRACIVHWARKNPSCPLCRQTVHTIIYPALPDQGFVEMAVPQPSVPQQTGPWEEPGATEPQPRAHVAGFPPETWALFFCSHSETLRPLELWLNEVLCGDSWWDVAFAQGRIVASLCCYGLHEEALAREVQPFLGEQTAAFVRQLIEVATDQCSELVQRHMDVAPQQTGPSAITFPGTSGVLEERREGLGQARARASGTRQSGGGGPGVSWQSSRHRGGSSQDTGAAHKKPCRRQN